MTFEALGLAAPLLRAVKDKGYSEPSPIQVKAIDHITLVVKDLGKQILKLKKMGQTILFSEQNIRFATLTSDRAYVIDNGQIRYQGSIDELSTDEEIKKKYLMI